MKILYLPNEYSQQRQREKKRKIYPVLMASEAEWYRKQGHEVVWDRFEKIPDEFNKIIYEPEGLPFLSLPHPDREFTRWWEYQDNGNFKYRPGTYIQAANGCWWGKCSFCVENKNLIINSLKEYCTCPEYQYIGNSKLPFKLMPDGEWRSQGLVGCSNQIDPFQPVCWKCLKPRKEPKINYEVRPVEDVIEEIKECKAMGFKEVFDDSGTFPIGNWLDTFCRRLYSIKPVNFSCNMRLIDVDYSCLRRSGFRMVLFGLESANQKTLDKINKGVKVEDYKYIIKAAKAGLEPHIAVMFGYPWESDRDARNTLRLVHYLLKKGYAKTAQASFYTPKEGGGNELQRPFSSKIYNIAYSPQFWFNKIRDIKNVDDLKYLWRCIKTGMKECLKPQ